MRTALAVPCYLGILGAAWRRSDSTLVFLFHGPALALLVDRYWLRLLPWKIDPRWFRELGARVAWFLVGAAGFSLLRLGVVPFGEAVYRGALLSLGVFVLESVVGLVSGPFAGWRVRWPLRLAAVGLLVLAIPVIAGLHPLRTVPKRTPAAFGLDFEDIRLRTADGVHLAAWAIPHPEARANVIFCHGHGRNRGHVAALLTTLHGLGMNVLAFDFRGHGDSEGHTSTFGCREVDDLLAAEAYVRGRWPEKPLILVGVSLGAAVCLQALPRMDPVQGVWSEGAFAHLRGPVENQFRVLPAGPRNFVIEAYQVLGWLDCGIWVPEVNPVDGVARTATPVYFCHAREDQMVPFAEGETLYQAHPGPRWHWWVEHASHYDLRQRNSAEYLARFRAFVEGCATRHADSGAAPDRPPSLTLPASPPRWSSSLPRSGRS